MNRTTFDARQWSEKHRRMAWFSFTTQDKNGALRCSVVADYIESEFFEIPYELLMITMSGKFASWKAQL